jgi:hypothetical protein
VITIGGKNMSKKVQRNYISEFRDSLTIGINGIVKAAEIYVEAIDADPSNAWLFQEEFADSVPRSAWARFEAVGRKWLHPKMILGGIKDRKKNTLIRHLPYSAQDEIFKGKRYELLTENGDILKVNPLEATARQAAQLIGDGVIRTVAEQKAILVDKKPAPEKIKAETLPYIIGKGVVTFRRDCTLTRVELKRILQEM